MPRKGEEVAESAMARARSSDGVGGLLELVVAERTRPPLGKVGDVVEDDEGEEDGDDEEEEDGGGGGGFRKFLGMRRFTLSGTPSVSVGALPAMYGRRCATMARSCA